MSGNPRPHQIWFAFNEEHNQQNILNDYEVILGHYCPCKVGARTLVTYAHITSVICRYLLQNMFNAQNSHDQQIYLNNDGHHVDNKQRNYIMLQYDNSISFIGGNMRIRFHILQILT